MSRFQCRSFGDAYDVLQSRTDRCGRIVGSVPIADIQEFGCHQKKESGMLPGAFTRQTLSRPAAVQSPPVAQRSRANEISGGAGAIEGQQVPGFSAAVKSQKNYRRFVIHAGFPLKDRECCVDRLNPPPKADIRAPRTVVSVR